MSALTDKIDAEIEAAWLEIAKFQSAYADAGKRYCQILASHSTPPKDGQVTPLDKPTEKAEGNDKTVGEFFSAAKLPASTEYSLSVTEYEAKGGRGFDLLVRCEQAGRLWERIWSDGEEAGWRARGWLDITPPVL